MIDSDSFLKRINGCSFEKDMDIVANLFLVLNHARPAYLYTQYDGDTKKEDVILKEIQKAFPNILLTKFYTSHFLHVNSLPQLESEINVYIGKALGFFFPGDIDFKENVYSSIHYLANEKHFYAEVCKTLINDVTPFKERETEWNNILNKINISVTFKLETSMETNYLLSIVINKDFESIMKYSKTFLAYFENMDQSLPSFASFLEEDFEKKIVKYYNYILMIVR